MWKAVMWSDAPCSSTPSLNILLFEREQEKEESFTCMCRTARGEGRALSCSWRRSEERGHLQKCENEVVGMSKIDGRWNRHGVLGNEHAGSVEDTTSPRSDGVKAFFAHPHHYLIPRNFNIQLRSSACHP